MLRHKIKRTSAALKGRMTGMLQYLLQDEASSGKFLLAATAIAIICANSPLASGFEHFWLQHISIGIGNWSISETIRDFINEGLMALFFLMVGLEIKREMVQGKLRTPRAASLPIIAAVGGMLVPALIYMSLNVGQAGFSGWGIPMATDIAFAVGILALLGKRVPGSLKLFLLTLAVVDDIGAVVIIALFYTDTLHAAALLWAAGFLAVIIILQHLRLLSLRLFVIIGVLLWVALHASGVHASIAGAILGLSAPIVARNSKGALAARLERALIPISTFVVIPLFALANAGVTISGDIFNSQETYLIGAGIVAGLIAGKAMGIVGASWILVRLRLGKLPENVQWGHIAGIGLLGGIGFTLSLFIAELALNSSAHLTAAKISVFIASIIAAGAGLTCLLLTTRKSRSQ